MEILKARRPGNVLMVAIPQSFDIAADIKIKPKLTDNRLYYKMKKQLKCFRSVS